MCALCSSRLSREGSLRLHNHRYLYNNEQHHKPDCSRKNNEVYEQFILGCRDIKSSGDFLGERLVVGLNKDIELFDALECVLGDDDVVEE